MPGFSTYIERRWRAAGPDDRFLSVSMEDMLGDAQFGRRVERPRPNPPSRRRAATRAPRTRARGRARLLMREKQRSRT